MNERRQPHEFEPSGFFALRTPLLPFDELLAWGQGLAAPSARADEAELDRGPRRRSCASPRPTAGGRRAARSARGPVRRLSGPGRAAGCLAASAG